MRRRLIQLGSFLVLGAIAMNATACRRYDRYAISLRDAQTLEPVGGATITTRYDFFVELSRAIPFRGPKRHKTTTNKDGQACMKVEPSLDWWFQIDAPSRPMHRVSFNEDGSLNHSLGRFDSDDGWITMRPFLRDEVGSLELAIDRVEKKE